MFNFVITRTGKKHIIAFPFKKSYLTMCGESLDRNITDNIFAADNTFRGLCSSCEMNLNSKNKYILKKLPTMFKKMRVNSYYDLLMLNRNYYSGAQSKFLDYYERYWFKLSKYKKLIKK